MIALRPTHVVGCLIQVLNGELRCVGVRSYLKPQVDQLQIGEAVQALELETPCWGRVVEAVEADAQLVGDACAERMIFGQRDQVELARSGEEERRQRCVIVDPHRAVVDIPSANLILRGDVVVHRSCQVPEVRIVRRLDRYKPNLHRCETPGRAGIGDENGFARIWIPRGICLFYVRAIASGRCVARILLQNTQVRCRNVGDALNGSVAGSRGSAEAPGRNARLSLRAVGKVGEEKQLVLHNRPTHLSSQPIVIKARILCARPKGLDDLRVHRVEVSVLEVPVGLPMKLVRSAQHNGVELTGVGMSEFRTELVLQRGEFLHRIDRDGNQGSGHTLVVIVDAFNREVVVPRPTPPLVLTPDCSNARFRTPWTEATGKSAIVFASKVLSICAVVVLIKGVAPDTSMVVDVDPISSVTVTELILFSSTAKFVRVVVEKLLLLTRIVYVPTGRFPNRKSP